MGYGASQGSFPHWLSLPLGAAMVLLLAGCTELPSIARNQCGNAVVEPGEDCDTYAAEGQSCVPAGMPNACRYACDGVALGCPSQSACGTDGLCHFATGKYARWGSFVPVTASRLVLGDLNGDGRQELLTLGNQNGHWEALPRLYAFDASGSAQRLFDPQLPFVSPTTMSVAAPRDESRATEQLVFGTDYGVGTLRVSGDGTVLPDAYASQALPAGWNYRILAIHGKPEIPLGDGILVLLGSGEKSELVGANGVGAGVSLGSLPQPLSQLAGELQAGNLDEGASSPCDEALFAFRGDPSVYAFSPCGALGEWDTAGTPPSVVVTLTEGHTADRGVRAAFIDQDAHLDLVLGDEDGRAYVAFGLGDGRFVADPAEPTATLGQAWPVTVTEGQCAAVGVASSAFPLALGDVDANGVTDWIVPKGVQLVQSLAVDAASQTVKLSACAGNSPFVGQWAIARVADLNRDGLLDLVAGAADQPDLDFLLGTGRERMNRSTLPTQGPVTHLITGDFDGDLISDLAYSEREPSATPSGQLLSIAYGATSGPPTVTLPTGHFESISQLGAANFETLDAIAELGVIATLNPQTGETLSVFIGSPGRHPLAPLGLTVMSGESGPFSGVPQSLVTGRFDGSEDGGVLALAQDGCGTPGCSGVRLWWVPSSKTTNLGTPSPSPSLPQRIAVRSSTTGVNSGLLFGGDVDHQGAVDAFLLSATTTPGQLALSRVQFPEDPSIWTKAPLAEATTTAGYLEADAAPALVDLDGDGWLDLLLILQDEAAAPGLYFLHNEQGRLDLSTTQAVPLDGQLPRGLVAVADTIRPRALVVTDDAVFELSASSGGSQPVIAKALENLPGGRALALGDVNGDGLLDLVLSLSGGVQIFAEVAAEP